MRKRPEYDFIGVVCVQRLLVLDGRGVRGVRRLYPRLGVKSEVPYVYL